MSTEMPIDSRTCVVLGGRTFIGRSLVTTLLKLGGWAVRIADSDQFLQLDPSDHSSLLPDAISSGRASYFNVNVRDKSQLIQVIEGSSAVFYVESGSPLTLEIYACYALIVQGAKNVINACRECKVKKLIYNSSADVVFDGSHDINDGDESLPYASKFEDLLSDLKAQAEALVLFANDADGLLTCALRPSNVFGPGDAEVTQFLVNQARIGLAKFIIGSGDTKSDFTYVENVAHALVCAEEALSSHAAAVSGKAFFITNLEPVKFWEFISLIVKGLGCQRRVRKLPASLTQYIALVIKWMHAKVDQRKVDYFTPVRKVVRLVLCTETFNCTAAQKLIGYSPVVSLKEGVTLTIEAFSHSSNNLPFAKHDDLDEQSKVDKLLGSGKVADILLWRNEKKTFACFLAMALLYFWFFFSGRTFISSATKLLLIVTVALSGYSILGSTLQTIPSSSFEVSEVDMINFFTVIAYMCNRVLQITRDLAQGEDWGLFFKVTVLLYILKLILCHFLTAAVGVGVVFVFSWFFVYEQYQEEIDELASVVLRTTREVIRLLMSCLPTSLAAASLLL